MAKLTVLDLKAKKGPGSLVMVTAYDYPTARIAQEAGVDLILVGDSLGMVVLGYDSTVPVTMEEMLHHVKAARRGAPETFLIADMPFLSFATPEAALENAGRFLKEGGADAVKLEGGLEVVPVVEALVRAGIPVLGHVGLTPQTASSLGGYRVQGKDAESARRIVEGARALEAAGVWGVVLEMVPTPLARRVTEELTVPTIGIGAGPVTDGQVLVFHDLVGIFDRFKPKFVKRYAEAGALMREAVAAYAREVREGVFPDEAHSFGMREEILKKVYGD
ncbi:3-methyl-2-oxobutanoate hydroxymethyltransferase [Marinithermus hydrothermalis]|uniref:3-methyl-2-oxobutanoate hydroxymethyltransferase n=1 Tax=Marinithermus hydrothermalis (strain DSM 14884 / JCM 11576 / T1) TaxID=869210 RepID=F2NLZ2_MARHT|nr:3-methyl-2-oxobutanoate hydroxymethyltransferase [Marinithermus hydrothermalis]AEB11249.1 3-methyl-2-oxobutanoatehydroxymethyltransferase [Marinithermus hydrothermalis DSM 14884]